MTLLFFILIGLLSSLPLGPSLYALFQISNREKQLRWNFIAIYVLADLIHLALAWTLKPYLTNAYINKGLLLMAAVFFILNAVKLWQLKGSLIQKNEGSTAGLSYSGFSLFKITLLNPGILLFYISLLATQKITFIYFVAFLLSFLVSLLFFLKTTQSLANKIKFNPLVLNKSAAVLFMILAGHFLVQIQ